METVRTLEGIGVGTRAVLAEVLRWSARQPLAAMAKSSLGPEIEVNTLSKAIVNLENQYAAKIKAAGNQELREILEAQCAFATDPELADLAKDFCEQGWDAPSALQLAMGEFKSLLEGAGGEFGERVADLDEIVYRLIQWMSGESDETVLPASGSFIIVADDLTPMDTIAFTDVVVGVVTKGGGPTSHTAIVCRARGIPAVVACAGADGLVNGQMVVIDPDASQVIINGSLADSDGDWWSVRPNLGAALIPVMANVGSVADAAQVKSAKGVGLLRTELFFLNNKVAPTRAEQQALYAQVLAAGPDGEIIVRTLDAGSDKPIAFLGIGREENPALGVRGQRVAAIAPKFYEDQLHAIKAAADAVKATGKKIDVWVMAPMIATIDEAQVFAKEARAAGITRVGIMVEIPAITRVIPHLKGVVDFLSVGTNDLSQYLFAADRVNSAVAALLNPWQPALLSTLEEIAADAAMAGIKVGVCGEAASDPLLAVVMAGLGINSVSASPSSVAAVTDLLSRVDVSAAKSAAMAARSATTARDAKAAAKGALLK
ncbi:MAG: PEP-utilizing enzyme [Actinobacteria bacterium]|nr:PEP-utilizing enzyme [Actinomycetota bacterium]